MGIDATGLGEAISAGSTLVKDAIDKIWPNPSEVEKAKADLIKVQMDAYVERLNAENASVMAQIQVMDDSIKNGGGKFRDGAGWVCVAGLAYSVAFPLLTWAALLGHVADPPQLDSSVLMTLLGSLLGLGATHAYQKVNQ